MFRWTTIVSIAFQNRPRFTRLTLYSVFSPLPADNKQWSCPGGHGVCIPTKTHWSRRTAAAKRAPGHLSLPAPHFSSLETDGVCIYDVFGGTAAAGMHVKTVAVPGPLAAQQRTNICRVPVSPLGEKIKKIIKFNIYIYTYVYV